MKFCINCKHYDNDGDANTPVLPVCRRAPWDDMVMGYRFFHSCNEARKNETLCGKSAVWFEAKDDAIPAATN